MRIEATDEQWRELLELGGRVYDLRLWDDLASLNLIGIYDDESQQEIYFSVLGNEADLRGFNVYEGPQGLNSCLMMSLHDRVGMSSAYAMQRWTGFGLYFNPVEQVSSERRERLQRLGVPPSDGEWPSFLSYMPGFIPFEPNQDEVVRLTRYFRLLLDAATAYRKTIAQEEFQLDSTVHFRKNEEGKWDGKMAQLPQMGFQVLHVRLENGEFTRLLAMRPHIDVVMQVGVVLPGIALTDENYDRPVSSSITLVMNGANGRVLAHKVNKPDISPAESALRTVVEFIEDHGIPSEIQVSNVEFAACFQDLCERCNIKLTERETMPEFDSAAAGMTMVLTRSKDGPLYHGLHRGPLS